MRRAKVDDPLSLRPASTASSIDRRSTLALRVHTGAETHAVTTKLVGAHRVNSILAALLTAISFGIELQAAAAAVGRVKPFNGRMQPVVLPSGAIMIRDEYNG